MMFSLYARNTDCEFCLLHLTLTGCGFAGKTILIIEKTAEFALNARNGFCVLKREQRLKIVWHSPPNAGARAGYCLRGTSGTKFTQHMRRNLSKLSGNLLKT